jgi:hypothetical protein
MIWLIGLSIFILVWIILHRVKHNSWEGYPPKYVPIRLPIWGYIIIFVISMMPVVNIMLFIIFLIGLVAAACEQEVQIKWLDPIFKFLSMRY